MEKFVMDEDQENYDNVIKTTNEIIEVLPDPKYVSPSDIKYDFTPISAADTFV